MATRGNHEIRMLRSRICMESDSNGCSWRLATQISKIMDRNEVKREKHGKFLTVLQLTQIHPISTLTHAVSRLCASSQLMNP
jgi:hypothetical protein